MKPEKIAMPVSERYAAKAPILATSPWLGTFLESLR